MDRNPKIKGIFETMEYGKAKASDSLLQDWLKSHEFKFGQLLDNKWIKDEAAVSKYEEKIANTTCTIFVATDKLIDEAVNSGVKAQQTWFKSYSKYERSTFLYSLARNIQKNLMLLSVVECASKERLLNEVSSLDCAEIVKCLYYYAGMAQSIDDSEFEPRGLVTIRGGPSTLSVIAKMAAALAGGNAVFVQSGAIDFSVLLFTELASKILPPGVMNYITSPGMRPHPLVNLEYIYEMSLTESAHLNNEKLYLVETASKSCMLVLEGADLDSAAQAVVDSSIRYNGQHWTCCDRVLVHEALQEKLVNNIKKIMSKLRAGLPFDVDCDYTMRSDKGAKEVYARKLEEIKKDGVEIFTAPNEKGSIQPAMLKIQPASSFWSMEPLNFSIFGITPFRTIKEAVTLANNSKFTRGACIWSSNMSQALEVANLLKMSTVWINSIGFCDTAVPMGLDGGEQNVYTCMKTISKPWKQISEKDSGTKTSLEGDSGTRIDNTYKLYIGGKQKRPSSNSSIAVKSAKGDTISQVPDSGAKDVQDAVEAAQGALSGWSKKAGFHRAQILYYIAENLELRSKEFAEIMAKTTGQSLPACQHKVQLAIEKIFYWAGRADKAAGNVLDLPKQGLNLTKNVPVGVVAITCPEDEPFLGSVTLFSAAIAMGNTVIMATPENATLPLLLLYQVFECSDLPGGVVNILTGSGKTITKEFLKHDDVKALWCFRSLEFNFDYDKRLWYEKNSRDWATRELIAQATQPKSILISAGDIFAN